MHERADGASAHEPGRRRSARRALVVAVLACAACRAPLPAVTPVPAEASETFTRARLLGALDDPGAKEAARVAAERALDLAPDWVAPRRFLDELLRPELVLPERLAAYQDALDAGAGDAGTLYLYGRLMGARSPQHFRAALERDPRLAWAWHGLAVHAAREGRAAEARRHERNGARHPRDPWEACTFDLALARYEKDAGNDEGAAVILETRLAGPPPPRDAALELACELALLELGDPDASTEARGFERALALVQDPDATDAMLQRLASSLALAPAWGLPARSVELALALRGGDAAEALRSALVRGPVPPRALAAMKRDGAPPDPVLAFGGGDARGAVETWLAGLPSRVLDASGVPREERLAELVRAARALPEGGAPAGAEARARFADALIRAGWFEEARALALAWWADDGDLARSLELRALAGLALVDTLQNLVLAIDRDRAQAVEIEARPEDGAPRITAQPVRDLDDVLRALVPALARTRRVLGGTTDVAEIERELVGSPRIAYGPLATIVHPGPTFSREDEDLGRGRAGERVPGFAALMDELGRFGVIGEVTFGGGPDAAILRKLWSEERAGKHLGQEWRGTVVWCDSTDVASRFARQGADIAGASVHEGYWIDVDAARAALLSWEALRERFAGLDGLARVERALAVRGPRRIEPRVRAEELDPLGEGERVALAVMLERGTPDEPLGRVTIDELLALLEMHEEGHLCDRARFYPLGRGFFRIVAFVMRAAFDAATVARLLEYRAELVALCEALDPRVALAGVLNVSGNGGGLAATQHPAAYRDLLGDLVAELERAIAADPSRFPGVDIERELLYQLHRVRPEPLRDAALALAAREFGLRAPRAAASPAATR